MIRMKRHIIHKAVFPLAIPQFILLFVLLFAVIPASAQDDELVDKFNPIMTAVISQSITPDARAGGMGDVGAATDPDVHSQAWNPAKYPFAISRAGVSIDYTPWLRQLTEGINLVNAAGYYRIGDYSAVSASIRYFSLGEVTTNDDNMTVKPYEFSIDAAYSRMLSETFSAAVALRYMYSDLSGHYDDNTKPGSAFAADIALYNQSYLNIGQRECQLGLGLNISNIGSKINYGEDRSYFIPTNLRLGASLMIPFNEFNRFTIAFDANKLLVPSRPLQKADESDEDYNQRIQDEYHDMSSISGIFKSFSDNEDGFKGELEEINFGIGLEYTYNDKFTLRGGYHHESESQGGRSFFTVGAGFRMNVLAIDAGYVIATNPNINALDQTLRVSLSFDFDGIKELFGRK
nr:type IX secretion system outer membrane channel protein PorV [Pseudoprevotella muciniphila]